MGLETIVLLFEPWLLRNLELDVFNELMAFVTPVRADALLLLSQGSGDRQYPDHVLVR